MSRSQSRPPRLFALVWLIAAAGAVGGGYLVQALAPGSTEADSVSWPTVGWLVGAWMAGLGVGEWRGIVYARHVRSAAVAEE